MPSLHAKKAAPPGDLQPGADWREELRNFVRQSLTAEISASVTDGVREELRKLWGAGMPFQNNGTPFASENGSSHQRPSSIGNMKSFKNFDMSNGESIRVQTELCPSLLQSEAAAECQKQVVKDQKEEVVASQVDFTHLYSSKGSLSNRASGKVAGEGSIDFMNCGGAKDFYHHKRLGGVSVSNTNDNPTQPDVDGPTCQASSPTKAATISTEGGENSPEQSHGSRSPLRKGESFASWDPEASFSQRLSNSKASSSMDLDDPLSGHGHRKGFVASSEKTTIETEKRRRKESLKKLGSDLAEPKERRQFWLNLNGLLKYFAKRVVYDPRFDYVSAFLILLNSLLLGAQSENMSRDPRSPEPGFFLVAERVFCACFTTELVLRIAAYGCTFFYKPGWGWNWFDFMLVTMQLAEEIMTAVADATSTEEQGEGATGNFGVMRLLRILRLIRVLRLARVMHLISELRTIIVAILSSMKALFWTLVLLFVMIFIVSVYFTNLVNDWKLTRHDEELTTNEELALVYYFGSLFRSLLTLFQVIVGGVDWDQVCHPLLVHVGVYLAPVWCLYVAFVVFALMNVVTGVFVENALKSAQHDQDITMIQVLKDLLDKADEDKSGTISWDEFVEQLDTPQMQKLFEEVDLDVDEAQELFRLLDADASGELTSDELINGCLRLRGPAKAIDLVAFQQEHNDFIGAWRKQQMLTNARLDWLSEVCLRALHPEQWAEKLAPLDACKESL